MPAARVPPRRVIVWSTSRGCVSASGFDGAEQACAVSPPGQTRVVSPRGTVGRTSGSSACPAWQRPPPTPPPTRSSCAPTASTPSATAAAPEARPGLPGCLGWGCATSGGWGTPVEELQREMEQMGTAEWLETGGPAEVGAAHTRPHRSPVQRRPLPGQAALYLDTPALSAVPIPSGEVLIFLLSPSAACPTSGRQGGLPGMEADLSDGSAMHFLPRSFGGSERYPEPAPALVGADSARGWPAASGAVWNHPVCQPTILGRRISPRTPLCLDALF